MVFTSPADGRTLPLPPAVVFDCDGTLADTETLSDRAWTDALANRGYTATTEDFKAVVGQPYAQNWAYFSERVDLGDPTRFRAGLRERFRALFETELELYPDALDTLRWLGDVGVRIGVASSSSHKHVLRVLERGAVGDRVAVVVGADDVVHHKPDPEPYVTAALRLRTPPTRAVAIEDTPVGVASAVGAGLLTVGVVRRYSRPDELRGADRIVRRITPAVVVPRMPRRGPRRRMRLVQPSIGEPV